MIINIGILNNESGQKSSVKIIKFLDSNLDSNFFIGLCKSFFDFTISICLEKFP